MQVPHLAHLCLIEFTTLSNWTNHFEFKGCWDGSLYFIKILKVHSISTQWRPQSVATFCGVWSGSFCPCPTKRTLGLYGLTFNNPAKRQPPKENKLRPKSGPTKCHFSYDVTSDSDITPCHKIEI